MLSTTVNPTDGLRFDGSAARAAEGDVHPNNIAAEGRRKELANGAGT